MGRLLAIDYGSKRIGIAVSDPLKIIASPLETIPNKEFFPFLSNYNKKEPIEAFIIGIPQKLNGESALIQPEISQFIQQIKQQYPQTPIHQIDERFTSKMAAHSISISGMSKKKKQEKGLVDKLSACIILQTYMEQIR